MIIGAVIFAVAFALGALCYRFILVKPDVKRMHDKSWHHSLRNFMFFTPPEEYARKRKEMFDRESKQQREYVDSQKAS